jgi:D-xylose 1-dehydrogenase
VTKPAIYPDLGGKTVFITGGGSGIGAAFALAFAQQGARVAFVDIAEDASRKLVETVGRETGHTPLFLRCDIRDIEALRQAIEQARKELGDISVLINNAGNDERHTFEQVTPAYWEDRMAINQRPMFFAAQAAVPQMKRLGGGTIINLSSIIWRVKLSDVAVYSIAKASVHGLTRALAREFGQLSIRVNTISPGAVWTERQIALWYTPEVEAQIRAGQCLPARVLPEDVAHMALFLASDRASKCTGQDFVVDGGWS